MNGVTDSASAVNERSPMQSFDCVIVHYAEIALKGRNRPIFEKQLQDNLTFILRGLNAGPVKRVHGRMLVNLEEVCDIGAIREALAKVFGVAWFGFAYRTVNDIGIVKSLVLDKVSQLRDAETMRVITKRSDKRFPLTSLQVNKEIGQALVDELGMSASMDDPQVEVHVEITAHGSFVFFKKEQGLGGLPVGVSGRVLCLMSGGIDSPVASWLMMKRGCAVDFIHFHPFSTSEEARAAKISEMVAILSEYSLASTLYLVPFLPFQIGTLGKISKHELVIFRRFMIRVAARLARQEGLGALVTGDSLGQVASQTMKNLSVAEESASMTLFRPLIGYDKEEIVALAREIGTFEVSIRDYRDCCSILALHPETRAHLGSVKRAEEKLDLGTLIRETMEALEVVEIGRTSAS